MSTYMGKSGSYKWVRASGDRYLYGHCPYTPLESEADREPDDVCICDAKPRRQYGKQRVCTTKCTDSTCQFMVSLRLRPTQRTPIGAHEWLVWFRWLRDELWLELNDEGGWFGADIHAVRRFRTNFPCYYRWHLSHTWWRSPEAHQLADKVLMPDRPPNAVLNGRKLEWRTQLLDVA